MARIVQKVFRSLAYVLATGVILLALLVGLVRLLLPLAPEYQEEVRRVAAEATGLDVAFDRISASWPLRGPELTLFDVQLSDPETGLQVIGAQKVAVGLSVFRLFGEGRLVPSRLGVAGARVDVVREAAGGWRVQGQPLEKWFPSSGEPRRIPEIDLNFEDLEFGYRDNGPQGGDLAARVQSLTIRLEDEEVAIDGRLSLGADSTGRLVFSALLDGDLLQSDIQLAQLDWNLSVDASGLDLPQLLSLALRSRTPLLSGAANLRLDARLQGFRARNAAAEFELDEMLIETGTGEPELYPVFGATIEWVARDDGWLFAARELRVARPDSMWPRGALSVELRRDAEGEQTLTGKADFLRIEDLYPLIESVATSQARADLLPAELRGDLRKADLTLITRSGAPARYSLAVEAERLGVVDGPGGITVTGISGAVVADQDGGRLTVETRDAELRLPDLFADLVRADELSGLLVWRVTADAVDVLSDSFDIRAPQLAATARFAVELPKDGRSARLDLDASARAEGTDALAFVPVGKLPPPVGDWLLRAIVAGRVTDAQVRFDGPLREWPFDRGEGVFRVDLEVEDVTLDYAPGWPAATGLTGSVIFDGVSLLSDRNTGRLDQVSFQNAQVRIADLRKGLLEVEARQRAGLPEVLNLLRALPVTAQLGPVMERLAGSGELDARVALSLPVLRPSEYDLKARVTALGNKLGLTGLDYGFENLRGDLRVRNTRLDAELMDATVLGEPVQIKLRSLRPGTSAFGHYALVRGSIPAERWIDALGLPYAERVLGSPEWFAMATVPMPGSGRDFGLVLRSDLRGVASELPAPLAKTSASQRRLHLELEFPETGVVSVAGDLDRELRWMLRLTANEQAWRIERGALRAGGDPALLPDVPGFELSGRLPELSVSEWLSLLGGADASGESVFREASLVVEQLNAFGQVFREQGIVAAPTEDGWRIDLDGERAKGRINLPERPDQQRPMSLEMQRLWLLESADESADVSDPRKLPPVDIRIDDFRLDDLNFGRLTAELDPMSDGIAVSSIGIDGSSFVISGDADWRVLGGDPAIQRSGLRLRLRSTDVADTLRRLGYGPVIEAPEARASGELTWPGGPGADFLNKASGALRFQMERGTLKEVDPGGGRLLGILSVSALPRRLSLDFSDLVDEGLGFDVLRGDFDVEAGNAYTCNLGLEGSVADLGIVGRTGIRDRDYDQLAVVRPHVSNMLAIGGAVVGGPTVGAAMLLISQIFRKPLSQLGETYYQVTGPWNSSQVKRIQRSDVDTARFRDCERYLAQILPELPGETELEAEPGSELPEGIVP